MRNHWNWMVLVALTLACGLAPVTDARAECGPSQMEEANLAYASAYEFLKSKSWTQAIPRLKSILEVCPAHAKSLRGLGMAYLGSGKLEEAKVAYEQAIKQLGNDAQATDYGNLGGVHARLKEWPQARSAYMKAKVLAPNDCKILFNLGLMHMGVQRYRDAVETLEQANELCPEYKDKVLPQLATACEKAAAKEAKMGNAENAQMYREKHSQYAGVAGGSTAYDVVKQKMKEKNYGEAVTLLKQILAEDPDRSAAWLTMARAQQALKQRSDAISSFEKYVVLKPEDDKGATELIIAYAEAGRCQEGAALAQKSVTKFQAKGKQYTGGIYYAWGKCLECTGRYSEAKGKFSSSVSAGDPKWASYSRQEMERMDQLQAREQAKAKKAAQGG